MSMEDRIEHDCRYRLYLNDIIFQRLFKVTETDLKIMEGG